MYSIPLLTEPPLLLAKDFLTYTLNFFLLCTYCKKLVPVDPSTMVNDYTIYNSLLVQEMKVSVQIQTKIVGINPKTITDETVLTFRWSLEMKVHFPKSFPDILLRKPN